MLNTTWDPLNMIDYALDFSIWKTFMRLTYNFMQIKRGGKSRGAGASLNKFMPQLPNWGSMFFGVLVGVFATSLLVFTFSTSDITLRIPTSSTKKAGTVAKNVSNNTPTSTLARNAETVQSISPEPRFDFYTELTKNSVEQPTASSTPTLVSTATGNKPATLDLKSPPKTINGYLVQAGHFRKSADADAIRAKLALNGLDAKVVASKERDGEIWHRVMLGPLKTEQRAKQLQMQLKNLEVESILVLKYN